MECFRGFSSERNHEHRRVFKEELSEMEPFKVSFMIFFLVVSGSNEISFASVLERDHNLFVRSDSEKAS
jgi:hypothetical protein